MSGDLVFTSELEPFDYLMFRGESDPRQRTAMASVALLDRSPGVDAVRAAFDRASRVVLRLRQRVVAPALPVANARWVVDADVDLTYHVRVVRAPAPGGLREVLDLATAMTSAPLDTARPLWEAVLVEGVDVDGAEAALIMKVSHSLTDGAGALELLLQLYDFERDADRGPMRPLPVPEDHTPTDLVRAAVRQAPRNAAVNAVRRIGGTGRRAARVVAHPGAAVRGVHGMAASARRVAAGPPAAPSPLLRRRGLGRRLDTLDVPLDTLHAAAKAAGCSVNDAYLAALCGALRRYHDELGVAVDAVPLAMPVNHRGGDDPAGGNRFSGARLAAPIGVVDPAERMRTIRSLVAAAVDEPALHALGGVAPLLSRLPTPLLGVLASSAAGTDVQASNVRGYPDRPYIAGAEIVRNYWFGPLPGVAMMVVLLSQAGTCHVGVHYDTASVTDGPRFARCLREGFDEVLAVAPMKQTAAVR